MHTNEYGASVCSGRSSWSHCQASKWTHAFNDGSAQQATRNGGSGAYILQPRTPSVNLKAPSGALSLNYTSQVSALSVAADFPIKQETPPPRVVFLSHSDVCTTSPQRPRSGPESNGS